MNLYQPSQQNFWFISISSLGSGYWRKQNHETNWLKCVCRTTVAAWSFYPLKATDALKWGPQRAINTTCILNPVSSAPFFCHVLSAISIRRLIAELKTDTCKTLWLWRHAHSMRSAPNSKAWAQSDQLAQGTTSTSSHSERTRIKRCQAYRG